MAFCFYNLSSIVNGLVYFDQFSMLSTTHLLLVLLGIGILLSGVWVISFPPEGGRGVDISTWSEGDHPTEMVATGDSDIEGQEEDEVYEDEPLPMEESARPESTRGRSQTQTGHGLAIITEPPLPISAPQLSPRQPSPPRSRFRNPLSRLHGREQTDSALVTSPPRRSRSTYTGSTGAEHTLSPDRQSSALLGRHRRRTTLEPGSTHTFSPPPHGHFPNPLSPSTSAIGGFSIGLSPISPGFSIVPRERRRRPTQGTAHAAGSTYSGGAGSTSASASAGAGDSHGSEQVSGAARLVLPHACSMRRVVSEGDADARERRRRQEAAAGTRDGLPYGTDVERGVDGGPAAVGDQSDLAASHGQDQNRPAKGRWKWLRDVVLGR